MKIPTQKGEHSYKCTEFSLKRKEGMYCLKKGSARFLDEECSFLI